MSAGQAQAAQVTNAGDSTRSGWYPNQSAMSPEQVQSSSFGLLFNHVLATGDQIDAQPLVVGNTVIVVSENNNAYGLDAASGQERWHRGPTAGTTSDLGVAVRTAESTRDPSIPGDPGCNVPHRSTGITSTPVIDADAQTVYFFAKHYAVGSSGAIAYTFHAVDVTTGAERAGFPRNVPEAMTSDNHPTGPSFHAQWQLQRAGLLLLDGVVYAAFAGHCDHGHYEGWVVGMAASNGAVTGKWVSVDRTPGAGIWQSGGGLVSDGPGRIFLTTGNGRAPAGTTPIASPPASLGQSVVRIKVGADRKLSSADFFTPYDAALLDRNDVDFGSGGPIALPDSLGTPAHRHLMVAIGKQGIAYLLDRDDLGGYRTGSGGGDRVLQAAGTIGGVWSRPSVWPGDGGWVWVNTASGGGGVGGGGDGRLEALGYGVTSDGQPRLTVGEGQSSDVFSLDSGAPVITSDGIRGGSGIVWIVRAPFNGFGAELRAYRAVPDPATKRPVLLQAWPIGRSGKFQPPGVGAGRIYVASRGCLMADETRLCSADTPASLRAYGSPTIQPLTGSSLSFPDVELGRSATRTATLTATRTVDVTGLSSSDNATFARGGVALPATLHTGDTLDVPVTFSPPSTGAHSAVLTADTDAGPVTFGLSGSGQTPGPKLRPVTPVSFGGVVVGGHRSLAIRLYNDGGRTLTVSAISGPAAGSGFSLPSRPTTPFTIPPSSNVVVDIDFDPTRAGDFEGTIQVGSDGGTQDILLSGTAATPPHVDVGPLQLDFGPVVVGQSATREFTVHNTGGSAATISRSQPPGSAAFVALTTLAEGTTMVPDETRTMRVRFAPTAVGAATDGWSINADDGLGQRNLSFRGTGVAALAAPAVRLGDARVSETASGTMTFTANGPVIVQDVASDDGHFGVGAATPALPAQLAAGDRLTVPVTFSPTQEGPAAATVTATTDFGAVGAPVQANGLPAPPPPPPPPTPPQGQGPPSTPFDPQPPFTPIVPPPDTTAPVVGPLRLAGPVVRFGLSEPASVREDVYRLLDGQRRDGRCAAPTRATRRARRCTRAVRVARATIALGAGTQSRRLPTGLHGRYRVEVIATDAAANVSGLRRLTFVR